MKTLTKVSFVCFFILALLELLTAFRFLTASQIMDYHQVAMGMTWDNFTPGVQTMTLNFMRAAGLGFLMVGVFILIILAVPFRKEEPWARWALIGISLIQAAVMGIIVLNVRRLTPATPPIAPFILFVVLATTGFFLYQGKKTDSNKSALGGER